MVGFLGASPEDLRRLAERVATAQRRVAATCELVDRVVRDQNWPVFGYANDELRASLHNARARLVGRREELRQMCATLLIRAADQEEASRARPIQLARADGPSGPARAGGPRPDSGAFLRDGRVHIVPQNRGAPPVSVPNKMGADGFTRGADVHVYDIVTSTRVPFDRGAGAVGDAIAKNPTPGWDWDRLGFHDNEATPEGVDNDALAFGNGDVKSFRIPSPDPTRYTDIVVNYTIAGEHRLHEGYVMKYGVRAPDGTVELHSYGEGNSWWQRPGSLRADWLGGPGQDAAWSRNHEYIAREALEALRRAK